MSSSWDSSVKVWDALTGRVVRTLKGHTHYVECVAFSPNGHRIASGSHDNTVKIWDASSGRELMTLKGHTSFVYGVAFSPDGKWVASASWDGSAKVWDASSGREFLHFPGIRATSIVSPSARTAGGSLAGAPKSGSGIPQGRRTNSPTEVAITKA